jgi:arginine utilization regulatory protein
MNREKEIERLKKLVTIYEYILNRMNEGVHAVDQEGVSIIYNQKMMEMESMNSEDVLDKNLGDVFQFLSGEASTLLQALRENKTTENVKQTYFNDRGKEITTVNNTFPVTDSGRVIGAIEIARDITRMEQMMRDKASKHSDTRYTFESIIGTSESIMEVIENGRRAARTSSSVLIIGETGTGKELFAQSIHNESARAMSPFISQNCAALPETLIESLLFGTVKGAFTGSVERPGLFETAKGGTLLLDEINSLSPQLQAKLLRTIQERKIKRVGDTKEIDVDIRIIATMNEDPIDAITENRLRKDLYYRLSVVSLFVPPLRRRREDIAVLARHFIQKYNRMFNMQVADMSGEVLTFFNDYNWPGNVRELEHAIEGAMNLMEGEETITFSYLPYQLRRRSQHSAVHTTENVATPVAHVGEVSPDLKAQLEAFEKQYIRKVMESNGGNVSRAARIMGISRQSLQYRLRKHGIKPRVW